MRATIVDDGNRLLDRVVDRGDHLELDHQLPPDGAGDGVLDETEESGLHPIPDQGVWHSQYNFSVFDGHRCNSRQIGLPAGVGNLFSQGFRTGCPQAFGVVHVGLRPWTVGSVHKPFHSCGRAPICVCTRSADPGPGCCCCNWLPCAVLGGKRGTTPVIPWPWNRLLCSERYTVPTRHASRRSMTRGLGLRLRCTGMP